MKWRNKPGIPPAESPLREQVYRLRNEVAHEIGGEDLPAMERAIETRDQLSFLFSRGYLFNTPRFAGMVVATFDNGDNLLNPGYERGTRYRLSVLGEAEGAVIDHKHYSGDVLEGYAPDAELQVLAGALQSVVDLRRQGIGDRVV